MKKVAPLKLNNVQRGFTLFEMIVALGVFSVAIIVILGSLLSMSTAQKKAISLSTSEDNLRFAIDAISKEIRTGKSYDCGNTGTPTNCTSGGSTFAFIAGRTGNPRIVYKWNSANESIEKSTDGGASFIPMTGQDIKIKTLKFYVNGVTTGDNLQPRVTIVIKAVAGAEKVKTQSYFNIQTTVTQREINS